MYSFKVDRNTGDILPVIVDAWNHCWDGVRYSLDGYITDSDSEAIWLALGRRHG